MQTAAEASIAPTASSAAILADSVNPQYAYSPYKVILSEMIDLKKERNFFETRVIEYQTGGALSWD